MITPPGEIHVAHKARVQEEDLTTVPGEIHRSVRAQTQGEDRAAIQVQAQEESP